MRRLLFFIVITAMGMGQGLAQSLIQTYTDRCTGQTQVFSVPMNGSTVVAFYNRSRIFTAVDFQNGTLQSWLEETYLWWSSLNPCSTATTGATTTQQTTQQTVQQATQAATQAATTQTPQINVSPPTTSPPTTQSAPQTTSAPVDTASTNTSAPTTNSGPQNSANESTPQTNTSGGTETGTGETGTTETTTEATTTETSESQTETQQTESTTDDSGGNDSSSSETEDSSTTQDEDGGDSESSNEETSEETESESEETEEQEVEESDSEESESEEESEEESDESPSEEDEEEEEEKKRALAPPIIMANVMTQQDPLGNFSTAAMFGVSQSSLMGDKTYGLNAMVYSNLQQFMLTANYSQVHINDEGRVNRVYSASIGGAKMYTTYMGMMNHSMVWLGKKGSVKGLAFGTSLTSLELDIRRGLIYYDEQIVGTSLTGFYTKSFNFDRLTYAPMLAVSTPFASVGLFHGDGIQLSSDTMFIAGNSFTYQLTKRFGANLGVNAITATIKDFPVIWSFTIGSKFSF